MKDLPIHIKISDELFLKDPESTDLGKRIISSSIDLMENLGFESFTFKKLGNSIGSPESSVYRYFDCKHNLLVYLITWYWSWTEYKLVFAMISQNSPKEKLSSAVDILTQPITIDNSFLHVNEVLLNKVVVAESTKVFHTKEVDEENERGYFVVYKRIINRVSNLILEVNPDYPFPQMLATTILEGALQQSHFVEHIPSITDVNQGKNRVTNFYNDLVNRIVG